MFLLFFSYGRGREWNGGGGILGWGDFRTKDWRRLEFKMLMQCLRLSDVCCCCCCCCNNCCPATTTTTTTIYSTISEWMLNSGTINGFIMVFHFIDFILGNIWIFLCEKMHRINLLRLGVKNELKSLRFDALNSLLFAKLCIAH